METLRLKLGNKVLKDGTVFRIGPNKYRVNFSQAGYDYNVDLWDYQADKPLSIIGTIKRNGVAEFDGMLSLIDAILKQ